MKAPTVLAAVGGHETVRTCRVVQNVAELAMLQ